MCETFLLKVQNIEMLCYLDNSVEKVTIVPWISWKLFMSLTNPTKFASSEQSSSESVQSFLRLLAFDKERLLFSLAEYLVKGWDVCNGVMITWKLRFFVQSLSNIKKI